LRSATNDDGRRVITLWRSQSIRRNEPRALNNPRIFHLKKGLKLRVSFTREEVPILTSTNSIQAPTANY